VYFVNPGKDDESGHEVEHGGTGEDGLQAVAALEDAGEQHAKRAA